MTTKTIALRHPFEAGGKPVSEVVFRRPKTRDMALIARLGEIEARRGEGGALSGAEQSEASTLLLRALTGLPEDVIGEIDLLEDLPRLAEEAAAFFEGMAPPAPQTGGQ